jgi:hypothetical protein
VRWPEHATAPVDSIVDDEKVIVARELVLVYAVQSTLLWCTAKSITVGDKAGILVGISVNVKNGHVNVPMLNVRHHQNEIYQKGDSEGTKNEGSTTIY